MNTISKSAKTRATLAGRNMAPKNITPAIFNVSVSQIEASLAQINRSAHTDAEAMEMRRGALDEFMHTATNGLRWADYYAAIAFVRDNDWYWKDKGFDSFDAYWRVHGNKAFSTMADLEAVYSFAKTACPALFNMTAPEAARMAAEIANLSKVNPMPNKGGQGGNTNGAKAERNGSFKTEEDAMKHVIEAAAYKAASASSMERRFARIRRDNPEVASRVLAGEFIKKGETGLYGVDIGAAEVAAFGKKKDGNATKTKKNNTPAELAVVIRRILKKCDPDEVASVIEANMPGYRVIKRKG